MINVVGNAWDVFSDYDALCITTNGTIKKDGSCVMGRGIALEAKQKIPGIDKLLGSMLSKHGNVGMLLGYMNNKVALISFPVKHDWFDVADINLIIKSASQLIRIADKYNLNKILLPRPGCGNGKLKWSDVEPVLSTILDDRFHVISFK